jgi:hypothetical protein
MIVGVMCIRCSGPGAARGPVVASVPSQTSAQVKSLVAEGNDTLRRGRGEGLMPLIEPTAIIIGPSASAPLERSQALLRLDAELGTRKNVTSRRPSIGLSSSGQAAWACQQLDVNGIRYWASAVVVDHDGLWTASTIFVGRLATSSQLAQWAKANQLRRDEVKSADSAGLGALFSEGVVSPEKRRAQLVDGNTAALWIDATGKTIEGAARIRKAWTPRRSKKKPEPAGDRVVGDTASQVSPDGSLGWVLGHVERGDETRYPVRVFQVYLRQPGGWKLSLIHETVVGP